MEELFLSVFPTATRSGSVLLAAGLRHVPNAVGFPGGSDGIKNLPAMQETWVRFLGWEDFPGEGNGYPLQYSCLENPMDRGAWWATVHGVTKSQRLASVSLKPDQLH